MPVTATNHTCVKDNVTGLMWEVKTDDGGLRDKDWTYSWFFNGEGEADYGNNCYDSNHCDTEKFVQDVNATNLCGHNDWRVPEPHELTSIVDYNIVYVTTIDDEYFPNTESTWFWTASPDNDPYWDWYEWIVDFQQGGVYLTSHGADVHELPVLVVRGGQLLFSFIDQWNGTVKDNNTGLIWAKCSQGQTVSGNSCSGNASYMTWQQALQVADSSTLAGYNDWRLPNVKELQSLADYTMYNPAISSNYFPNTDVNNYYWTGSTSASYWIGYPYSNFYSNCSLLVGFVGAVVSPS